MTVNVTGSGNGNTYAGGVCGSANRTTITNCYNTVSVTGSNNRAAAASASAACAGRLPAPR